MRIKTIARGWIAALPLIAFLLFPIAQLSAQSDKVAAFKQALGENQKKLAGYTWTETTIISLKGEEKSRTVKQCAYGPDGKVQKTVVSEPAPQEAKRGLKGKMIAKKKGEISDYMKEAVALVQQYVPPDQQLIGAAKEGGNISMIPGAAGAMTLDIKNYVKANDGLGITINGATNAIQKISVKSYLDSPSDVVTLDVNFATLPAGVNYPGTIVLNAPAKNIQVNIQNSDYLPR